LLATRAISKHGVKPLINLQKIALHNPIKIAYGGRQQAGSTKDQKLVASRARSYKSKAYRQQAGSYTSISFCSLCGVFDFVREARAINVLIC
jgi:hypothetical protein